MSVWTHVVGCIRFDGFPTINRRFTVENAKRHLGNTCDFESEDGAWEKCTVPKGSEGSLQYEISEVGQGLVWLTVAIWGDLRDYDNVEEITVWFERVTQDKQWMVRGAVLEIQVEQRPPILISHSYKDEEFSP